MPAPGGKLSRSPPIFLAGGGPPHSSSPTPQLWQPANHLQLTLLSPLRGVQQHLPRTAPAQVPPVGASARLRCSDSLTQGRSLCSVSSFLPGIHGNLGSESHIVVSLLCVPARVTAPHANVPRTRRLICGGPRPRRRHLFPGTSSNTMPRRALCELHLRSTPAVHACVHCPQGAAGKSCCPAGVKTYSSAQAQPDLQCQPAEGR